MSENGKKACYNFLEPNETYLNSSFYMTNSTKPKDFKFMIMYDTENRKIFTFEKLKPANHAHFC